MRSHGQGLMATLLMFVPLLAVPIVATFGVPWLSAKAKLEGVSIPEFSNADLMDTGVGQSQTARHSADDLFAPVLDAPAVDLRPPANELLSRPSVPTGQNPHLQNASMVVSQGDAWNDPFSSLHDRKMSSASDAGQEDSFTPPQIPDNWTIKDTPPETPSERVAPEAPLPQEFPESDPVEKGTIGVNPFSVTDANPPQEEVSEPNGFEPQTPDPQVTVGSHAFEDPNPSPRINRDPEKFDASRELFLENKQPSTRAMQTAEVSPPSTPPAAVGSNAPSSLGERAPAKAPLTWDTARARLNQFGITHYYLQPDAQGQVFHFRCAYSPGGNSRINRLFEAEAPTPLEAVSKVLAQLEASKARTSAPAN